MQPIRQKKKKSHIIYESEKTYYNRENVFTLALLFEFFFLLSFLIIYVHTSRLPGWTVKQQVAIASLK